VSGGPRPPEHRNPARVAPHHRHRHRYWTPCTTHDPGTQPIRTPKAPTHVKNAGGGHDATAHTQTAHTCRFTPPT
jgi:hypothetical protein